MSVMFRCERAPEIRALVSLVGPQVISGYEHMSQEQLRRLADQ
jgi:hypothetical protein